VKSVLKSCVPLGKLPESLHDSMFAYDAEDVVPKFLAKSWGKYEH
jgi:hypothetical protein